MPQPDSIGKEQETINAVKAAATSGGVEEDLAASVTGSAILAEEKGALSAMTHYRWVICSLLFFATTINYVDRAVLGYLEPTLEHLFHWTKTEYGWVTSAFQFAYGIGFLFAGWFIDRIGTKKGFSIFVVLWSVAAMGHSLARNVVQLAWARGFLGLAESGNFPCAIKSVAEWFPKKERALATGIFNAGSNVGLTIAPLAVPFLALKYGWQSAFVFTGALGFIWLTAWLIFYRDLEKHPGVSASEKTYIRAGSEERAVALPWSVVLPSRQTWAFATGKLITDPAWWFLLFWLPPILHDRFHLDLKTFGLPLFIIYVVADVGSVAGGWLSGHLLGRRWSVNKARKTAMLVCALCVLPIVIAGVTPIKWVAVGVIALAAAAHQGWSANLFTLVSDMFPRRAVASVVGIGGLLGAFGGAAFQPLAGHWRDTTGSYELPLIVISCAYLISLLIIHLLVPRMDPAEFENV